MIINIISAFVRMLTSLRYRVEVRGADAIPNTGGLLFLSNHPAFIDPAINFSRLWPKYRLRPLVIDYMYNAPVLRTLFRRYIDAISVPDFSRGANSYKRLLADQTLSKIVAGLSEGKNFLIYPSGRLQRTAEEQVGGASAVHEILQQSPKATIVLMRVRGLWGSMFGWGLTGDKPQVSKKWRQMVLIIIKNLFLFVPRRKVTIELELAPAELPRLGTRHELNRWLEGWFNRVPESLSLVSYSRWRKELPVVAYNRSFQGGDIDSVPQEARDEVLRILSRLAKRPADQITPEMHLFTDLGLDSLDIADLTLSVTDAHGLPSDIRLDMMTVGSTMALAAGQYNVGPAAPIPELKGWEEGRRPDAGMPEGSTLHEAFFCAARRMGSHVACADVRSGVLSFKRMRHAVQVLAGEIRSMPGERIGIMLPASCGAQICLLAVLLAGKVPVMINWTAGPRALEAMKEDMSVVLSSMAFLNELDGADLTPLHDQIVLLEDIKKRIGLFTKLRRAYRSPKLRGNADDIAVILFTSGTESLPKGVPLTHRNILSNQRAAGPAIDITSQDILFSMLPPFHSFGFTITGIFPILTGCKVFYSPRPTDGFRLAGEIDAYKPTLLCAAPTFLKGIKSASKPEQLSSLRLIITGAERTPREIFEWVDRLPDTQIIEGYGITECAPILTLNRPGDPPAGVGRPIVGVELRIVHAESYEPLPQGETGLILARGPNVFSGYLGDQPSPFILGWYNTGDLGFFDETGALHLAGRQKRFVKMGGEMISLPALEEAFAPLTKDRHLAVVAVEREGSRPELHLYATFPIDVPAANEFLQAAGMSPLAKITATHHLDHMPFMGTGKVNLRKLQELAE